jgi:hypothetical protein
VLSVLWGRVQLFVVIIVHAFCVFFSAFSSPPPSPSSASCMQEEEKEALDSAVDLISYCCETVTCLDIFQLSDGQNIFPHMLSDGLSILIENAFYDMNSSVLYTQIQFKAISIQTASCSSLISFMLRQVIQNLCHSVWANTKHAPKARQFFLYRVRWI